MTELLLIIGRILHPSFAINVGWKLTVEFCITRVKQFLPVMHMLPVASYDTITCIQMELHSADNI
jgi:hypothetical protein